MTEVRADPTLLHRMMAEVSAIGATRRGGVHRLAASREDGQARDWLKAWLTANGFRAIVDAIGNLFGVADLAGPDAPLVLTGSHLDSQPMGGRFDGAYGVIAACAAAVALKQAVAAGDVRPTHNIGVVSWTNEEGARFQPSLIGSSVYAGLMPPQTGLAIRDADGIALGDALRAIGYDGGDAPPTAAHYVELHVECGPELEAAERTIGVVVGWWGAVKARVSFLGEQAHTGPTAMARRRDALYGAGLLIGMVRGLADEVNAGGEERLYTSVGRLEVEPNSPNVVPGKATLFIELRSADSAALVEAETTLRLRIDDAARMSRTEASIDSLLHRPVGHFDEGLVRLVGDVAERQGHRPMQLMTIAAHDAIPLASIAPSVVVVTPSAGGLCHHEAEYTAPEDLEAGLQVLTATLAHLCRSGSTS